MINKHELSGSVTGEGYPEASGGGARDALA